MDFGRIKESDAVDYRLPADHKSLAKILGASKVEAPDVYAGGVLWSDEGFRGTIYPETAKPKDFVKYYTKQFNTIELNLTHYRTPEADKVKHWYSTAKQGFKFCPKVHQDISHSHNLPSMLKYHNECAWLYRLLNEKLGTCFMQLPPHFSPKRLNELLDFLDGSDTRNMAIELRHENWFNGSDELNTLSNHLYKNGMGLVLTDTPGRRDVLHMRLTNKTAFIRFNANDDHSSDRPRIDEWIDRIALWFDLGLENVYFFVHTPNQVFMPHLVTYFIHRLQAQCGIKLTTPVIRKASRNSTLF